MYSETPWLARMNLDERPTTASVLPCSRISRITSAIRFPGQRKSGDVLVSVRGDWFLTARSRPGCSLPVLQALHFRMRQMANFTWQQTLVRQKCNSHPLQLHNSLANALKHPPHLMVAPLDERNLKPRLVILPEGAN